MRQNNQERLKILAEVQAKRMTTQEAMQALQALDIRDTQGPAPDADLKPPSEHILRVRQTRLSSGKTDLDLSIPANLVAAGFRLGADFGLAGCGLDQTQILNALYHPATLPLKLLERVDEENDLLLEVEIL